MLTTLHFLQETNGSVAPGLTGKDKVQKRIKAAIHIPDVNDYAIDPAERDRLAREASSDTAKIFYAHKGRLIHKWIHYLDIYDGHFSAYRNTPVKMLEIGVSQGGSLELWREIFREGRDHFWDRHRPGMRIARHSAEPGSHCFSGRSEVPALGDR
jgi:hypothetical protein